MKGGREKGNKVGKGGEGVRLDYSGGGVSAGASVGAGEERKC